MRPRFWVAALALLPSIALAQTPPSPAKVGITSTTAPEVVQILDSTKTWATIGAIDPTTHIFTPVGGGSVPEAPNDGTLYGRKSAAWSHLTHSDVTDWTATLAPYALLNSPAFTGTPSLPTGATGVTQSPGDSSTKFATTAFVGAAVTAGATAPGGTAGQIQYKNGTVFGGFTASGDATINTGTGAVAVTKTGGVAFGGLATVTPGAGVATAAGAAANGVGGMALVSAVPTVGDFVKWAAGGIVDGGAGGASIIFPQTISGTVNSGGIPYFSSTTVMSSSALLAANALMVGGGAGVAPSTVTTNAAELTALGVAPNTNGGHATATTTSVVVGAINTGGGSGTAPVGLADVATGSYLKSNGVTTIPAWQAFGANVQNAVNTALNANGGLAAAAAPLTVSTGGTMTGAFGYYVCTTTCSVTLPTPAAGFQFCVRNDSTVVTVITIVAISSVQFEKTSFNGYGTVTTGKMTSGGALGDKICLVGRDATHYLVGSFVGVWTNT